jgi:TIR domain
MIAISYRREDSLPIAGRLYDRLQNEFGKNNVLMDFDSIPYGVDFRDQIKEMIDHSDVVIALIGPDWFGQRKRGVRRLDDPADFVRLEITYALQRDVPLIPVLIDHTPMPKATDLPKEIEGFAFRNALTLNTGIDFHHHADRLIAGVRKLLPPSGPGEIPSSKTLESPATAKSRSGLSAQTKIIVGAAGVVLVGLAVWLVLNLRAPRTAAVSSASPPPAKLVEPTEPNVAERSASSATPAPPATSPMATPVTSTDSTTPPPLVNARVVPSWPALKNQRSAEALVAQFVRQFIRSSDLPDVDAAASFYALDAQIFDEGRKSLEAIRRDIETYNERWPFRTNTIRGNVRVTETVPERVYTASFQQDFRVANRSNQWINGSVTVDLEIIVSDGSLKVSSIKQKVLRREKGPGVH